MKEIPKTPILSAILFNAVLCGAIGCATAVPYISNRTDMVVSVAENDIHPIAYIRVYEDDGELRMYGKVDHYHDASDLEPTVHVTIADPRGKQTAVLNLPLRSDTGHKSRGWFGASFRTEMRPIPEKGSRITAVVSDHRADTAPGD